MSEQNMLLTEVVAVLRILRDATQIAIEKSEPAPEVYPLAREIIAKVLKHREEEEKELEALRQALREANKKLNKELPPLSRKTRGFVLKHRDRLDYYRGVEPPEARIERLDRPELKERIYLELLLAEAVEEGAYELTGKILALIPDTEEAYMKGWSKGYDRASLDYTSKGEKDRSGK